MKVLQRMGSRIERQHLSVVLVALLIAVAGCSGLGGQDGTATDGGPTTTPTNDSADGGTGTPTIEDTDVTAEEVVGPAVETIGSVDSYKLSGTLNVSLSSSNRQQSSEVRLNTSVDRANDRLASSQTTSSMGQTITSETYVVNGTVYQYSPQLAQAYNSEWITLDVPNGTSDQFNRNDELAAHSVMLENSSATVVGIQNVDGERAYRLDLAVDASAVNAFYGFSNSSIGIDSIETTVWIDTESNRLLRASGTIQQAISAQGQTVDTTIRYDERFEYTDVDVTLPDAASSAVEVNGTTGAGV